MYQTAFARSKIFEGSPDQFDDGSASEDCLETEGKLINIEYNDFLDFYKRRISRAERILEVANTLKPSNVHTYRNEMDQRAFQLAMFRSMAFVDVFDSSVRTAVHSSS